ncbi:MAG: sulfotransferase domain-containing protein [Propionibacteriaceae bacterium]
MTVIRFLGQARGGSSVCYSAIEVMLRAQSPYLADIASVRERSSSKRVLIGRIQRLAEETRSAVDSGRDVVFGPIRDTHDFELLQVAQEQLLDQDVRSILVTRDPVDTIVSWYYARILHSLPATTQSLSGYVLRQASAHAKRIDYLVPAADEPSTLVSRYEDVWSEPDGWLSAVVRHLALPIREDDVAGGAAMLGMRTTIPHPLDHQRDGRPGSGRELLGEAIAARLDVVYSKFNSRFQYPLASQQGHRDDDVWQDALSRLRRNVRQLMTENGYRMMETKAVRAELEALNQLVRNHLAPVSGADADEPYSSGG